MKGRKQHRATGGVINRTESPSEVYSGAGSNVVKEARQRKRGGRVGKEIGHAEGKLAKMRLDRPGRKSGGRVGAEKAPLSMAAKTSGPDDGPKQMPQDAGCYKRGGKVKKDGEDEDDRGGSDHWIAGAVKHPGALHRELHVPQGEKIPAKKLAKAAHSDNPKLAKRARLAETLKSLH